MKRNSFIISRTDAIGDVVLTLPVAGVLKTLYPGSRIFFLGRSYTREVVQACEHVDEFLNWDELKTLPEDKAIQTLKNTTAGTIIHVFPNRQIARLAKRAGISERVGTTNRIFHWWTCNTLVKLSRRHSPYHEAQLNLKLLEPLGGKELYSLEEIGRFYGLTRLPPLPQNIAEKLDPHRFNLVLHPKSRGSAREWGLDNFSELIGELPKDRFNIFVTGTRAEGELLQDFLKQHQDLINLTGKLSLGELMTFLSKADGLIAASTGPLHLAAALGINALGIYPPIKPMHPGRWAPIGPKASVFVKPGDCEACRKTDDCACMRDIRPELLSTRLLELYPSRGSRVP